MTPIILRVISEYIDTLPRPAGLELEHKFLTHDEVDLAGTLEIDTDELEIIGRFPGTATDGMDLMILIRLSADGTGIFTAPYADNQWLTIDYNDPGLLDLLAELVMAQYRELSD